MFTRQILLFLFSCFILSPVPVDASDYRDETVDGGCSNSFRVVLETIYTTPELRERLEETSVYRQLATLDIAVTAAARIYDYTNYWGVGEAALKYTRPFLTKISEHLPATVQDPFQSYFIPFAHCLSTWWIVCNHPLPWLGDLAFGFAALKSMDYLIKNDILSLEEHGTYMAIVYFAASRLGWYSGGQVSENLGSMAEFFWTSLGGELERADFFCHTEEVPISYSKLRETGEIYCNSKKTLFVRTAHVENTLESYYTQNDYIGTGRTTSEDCDLKTGTCVYSNNMGDPYNAPVSRNLEEIKYSLGFHTLELPKEQEIILTSVQSDMKHFVESPEDCTETFITCAIPLDRSHQTTINFSGETYWSNPSIQENQHYTFRWLGGNSSIMKNLARYLNPWVGTFLPTKEPIKMAIYLGLSEESSS
jgi:hypothetical protein